MVGIINEGYVRDPRAKCMYTANILVETVIGREHQEHPKVSVDGYHAPLVLPKVSMHIDRMRFHQAET